MEEIFPEVKKKLGFGCMRLRMKDTEVDEKNFCEMIDTFIENGFNYFDTAHGYIDGKSERAIKVCLSDRYERDKFLLADKLSDGFFEKQEDIRPFLEKQLRICGVDYFDFYLMHAQNKKLFEKYKKCRAYETAAELKKEGKIKHLGISFHDTAEVLEEILTAYPEVEVVQIQFNYADFEDASVQSRKVYEVCRKFAKPIIVMEPVKGGSLVNLPEEAQAIFADLGGGSNASYAIRFAASFEGIFMTLSGMGNLEMVRDNIGYMKDFRPIDENEMEAVGKVCKIFHAQNLIPCTDCKYCTERCPKKIPIPSLFSCMNDKIAFNNWNSGYYYGVHTEGGAKASDCIGCGACEAACPQKLPIRKLLRDVAAAFEKNKL